MFVRFSPVCSYSLLARLKWLINGGPKLRLRGGGLPGRGKRWQGPKVCFAFSPGTSKAMGTDGPIEVNTLEHVIGHLQKRIAGGAYGAGFDLYSRMHASSVKPFVPFFPVPPSPLGEGAPWVALFAVCLFLGEVPASTRKALGIQGTSGR